MKAKRKPGRPKKHNFILKIGQKRRFPYSDNIRISALQWGRRNGVQFKTTKVGELLIIEREL